MSQNTNDVKIKRKFMRDEAYEILRDWIMMGKLESHTKLKDVGRGWRLYLSEAPGFSGQSTVVSR